MTLSERLLACDQLIESLKAERIGLVQACIGKPISPLCFQRDHERQGYERGYAEGRDILEKGEGL